MQVNVRLFSEKEQGVFTRAGVFIKINTVSVPTLRIFMALQTCNTVSILLQ